MQADMSVPQSNRTIEGTLAADQWLQEHPELPSQLRSILLRYYQEHGRDFPWRRTGDPYKILVAEMLLQKTGVKPVENIWAALIHRYPDIEALATAPFQHVEEIIRSLGLRKRAKVLYESAQYIVSEAEGKIVGDALFLETIPGVGKYTAAALLSFAFNITAATIDVNAARVYTRICGFSPKTLRQGLAFARVLGECVITPQIHREINYSVLDLSAQVCRPKPLCSKCPISEICQYARVRTGNRSQTDKLERY
jgi:A/G-specific adenine glycosylase